MDDIERRLQKLEKHARDDIERWHAVQGEIKAFSAIISCMGAPIAAQTPDVARFIVRNLKTYEDVARMQNEDSQMIERLRVVRGLFEAKLKKRPMRDSGDAKRRGPPRGK